MLYAYADKEAGRFLVASYPENDLQHAIADMSLLSLAHGASITLERRYTYFDKPAKLARMRPEGIIRKETTRIGV